ncbi:MAG: GEVED domain-containing protein [Planctomycetota bacterium]
MVTSRGGGGGVFRSTNGGATFASINSSDFADNDNFSDLVEDPTAPNRLYAANTGEAGLGGPGGIYRSEDFGLTWTKITGSAIDSTMNDLLITSNNIEMAVSPQTGRLYVAALLSGQPEAVYHTNTSLSAAPTWTRMDIPVLPQGEATAITFASNTSPITITSPQHGLVNPARGAAFVVIDGVTGNTAANGFHRINVINSDQFQLTNTTGNGAYISGGTWTRVATPSPTPKDEPEGGAQGRTHFSIVADPTNEDIVYLGGDRHDSPNAISAFNISGSIFRGDASLPSNPNVVPSPQWDHLTNNIVDFDPEGGTASNSAPHADSREMVFDANGNLVEVDDGGIYLRTNPRDNTGDWHSLVGNLAATELHDIAYDTLSNTLIAGLQDNGTLYQPTQGATFWEILSGGDGGDVVVDTVSLAATNQSIRYTSFQNLGGFRRSTWDAAGNLISEFFPALSVTSGPAFDPAFSTPVELNLSDPTRLLFGMDNGLYESFDQGETIQQVAAGISVTRSTGGNALAYGANSNGDLTYAGDFSGNVHIRTTSGGAFSQTDPDPSSTATIRDVVLDPNSTASGFAIDFNSVFVTTNNGANWSDLTGNLPTLGATGFRALEFVSGPSFDTVLLGTQSGIYSLRTDQTDWVLLGSDFPNSVVFDMEYDEADDVLVVATMGRGAWTLDNVLQELEAATQPLVVELDSTNGELSITGVDDFGDDVTLQADVANSQFVFSSLNQTFTVDPSVGGAVGDGTGQVTVPFSPLLLEIIVETLGGDDEVTLDLSLGDFPLSLLIDGGDSNQEDTLYLTGSSPNLQTITPIDAGFGDIVVDSNAVTFASTESVVSSLGALDTTVAYSDAAETLSVTPFGLQQELVLIGSSLSESIAVLPARRTLTIDGGDVGDNTITMIGSYDLNGGSIDVIGDQVTLDGVNLFTEGNGEVRIEAERNLLLDDNTLLRTESGDITLIGNQTAVQASGDFNGIEIDHATVTTVSGAISITGRGGTLANTDFNRGIGLFDNTVIESESGPITLTGTGGSGDVGMRGIQIGSDQVRIRSIDGDISLRGTGGVGNGWFHQGIIFFGGTVESTGDATITLEGIGGSGGNSNIGILVQGAESAVTSTFGDIFFEGMGGTTGNFNFGVLVSNEGSVRSIGTGANAASVTIVGVGGAAADFNRGIQLSGTNPQISTIDGDLSLVGTVGDAVGNGHQGIIFFSGNLFSEGTGDIQLDGTGLRGSGIFLQGGSAIEATQSGDTRLIARGTSTPHLVVQDGSRIGSQLGAGQITLTADTLDISNANRVEGTGDLRIQPLDPAVSVGIGTGTGTHNLSTDELLRLADGFASITIGRSDGSGQVTVDAVTFNDPLTIIGGGVTLEGTLAANDNPVELIANGGEINNTTLFDVPNVEAGSLRLTGTISAANPTGTLVVEGDVTLSDDDVFQVTIEGTNTIQFDRVSTTDDFTIENNVQLVTQPSGGFVPSIGDQFIIVDNLGPNPINGEFVGLPEGARIENFLGSNHDARITYQSGTGNEVALIVVDRAMLDFGDAPDTYRTLTGSFGPWHLATGPRLGALRDTELDGFDSLTATGDDTDGVDDEDGVMFGVVGVGMTMAGVNVDLQNAGTAQINAWIDFDADGVFQDDEQILTNRVVFGGLQTLNYVVNDDAVTGETFARVRVSSSGGLGIGGFASDGEVEDYVVTIVPRPIVDSISINGGEQQRSLLTEVVVTFDSEVDAPANAFEIRDRSSGTVLDTLQVSNVVNGAGQTVSTLTFGAGGNLVFDRANGEHTLVDGNYVLAIDSSLIQLAGGGPSLESDIEFGTDDVDGFFRFFGDSDGDRDVDGQDFGRFALSFPKTLGEAGFNPIFDSDGDDDVDGQDFGRVAANFLGTI